MLKHPARHGRLHMEVLRSDAPQLPEIVGLCPCGCTGKITRAFVEEREAVTGYSTPVKVRTYRYTCSCGSTEECPRTWFHTPFAAAKSVR